MSPHASRRTIRARLSMVMLGAVIALGGCGSDSEPESSEADLAELTIGNSVPLSGGLRDFGPDAKLAAKLAIDEIDSAVGDGGAVRAVDLITVDNETDPSTATRTADELVADGADCLIGPWTAPGTISVTRSVAIPEELTVISPAASADVLTRLEDDGLVSRTALPDSAQGQALAEAIADDLGGAEGRTVNVAARDDAYGQSLANAFVDAWREREGSLGARVSLDRGAQLDSSAEELVGGDPDATVIFEFPDAFSELAAALLEFDSYDPETTWAADLLASTELRDDLPAEAIDGIRGTLPGIPEDSPATAAFAKRFVEADEGEARDSGSEVAEPSAFAARTYDAVIVCYLAAVAARADGEDRIADLVSSVSGPPGKSFTAEQLPAAAEALEAGKEIDYRGVTGELDIDAFGNPTAGVYDIYDLDEDGNLVLTDAVAVGSQPDE